jgi:hypothetical protein
MSSGRKVLRQNTRERIISTDFNRMQSFIAAYANEAMREQMLVPQDDSFAVGTTFPVAGALTTAIDIIKPFAPMYGGVLNGLMVVVPAAAQYLLVTSGMLLMIDPDGQPGSSNPNPPNPDDLGPAKLVYSGRRTNCGFARMGTESRARNPCRCRRVPAHRLGSRDRQPRRLQPKHRAFHANPRSRR